MVRRRWKSAVGPALAAVVLAAACSSNSSPSPPPQGTAGTSTGTVSSGEVRLIAGDGLGGVLDRERARRREAGGTAVPATGAPSTTAATTTTAVVAPAGVAQLTATFVDSTRSTPARAGGAAASTSRTIRTTIWYPTGRPPTADDPTPPAYATGLPLVVFAHGFAIDAASYAPLLHDLAAGGYVVAAPDFPGTSTAYPGAAVRSDSLQQPGDISFVITSVQAMGTQPGPLSGALSNAVGINGQSDGGVTALATGWNTCCADPRIGAGAIYTGAAFAFDGQWFPPGSPPVMFVHATADEINPYSESVSMYQQAQSPKAFLTIEGGSHLEVYIDPPWEPQVAAATVAFFDQYLKGDPTAAARLQTVGNQPGFSSLQTG